MAALDPKPGEFFIDATLDGGGYARAILGRIGGTGRFLGIDWDTDAVRGARDWLASYETLGASITLASGNFAYLPDILSNKRLGLADGLVFDLGFSSDQLEGRGRGFSFLRDEPLLMTYSDESVPVRDLLKKLREAELTDIISTLGEERYAPRIARAIKQATGRHRIETSATLASVIAAAVPKKYERGRLHPATRTFLALRIYVNHELENLEMVLRRLPHILRPGGRIAIVSFHSLEDRLVKNFFKGQKSLQQLTKKPLIPSQEEVKKNPRSRSARLRAAVKKSPNQESNL